MSERVEKLKKQYTIGEKGGITTDFPVPEGDIDKMTKAVIILGDGKKLKEMYYCPYCFPNDRPSNSNEWRFNNIDEEKEVVGIHMMICHKNPNHIVAEKKRKDEYDRLFKTFGFGWNDYEGQQNAPTKMKESKFLMAAKYNHKAIGGEDSETFDLITVTHETEEAYLGAFVFGIGMFNVIFPKADGNVRILNEKEIKQYQGANIAISSNPAHVSLNIKENKYDSPIPK